MLHYCFHLDNPVFLGPLLPNQLEDRHSECQIPKYVSYVKVLGIYVPRYIRIFIVSGTQVCQVFQLCQNVSYLGTQECQVFQSVSYPGTKVCQVCHVHQGVRYPGMSGMSVILECHVPRYQGMSVTLFLSGMPECQVIRYLEDCHSGLAEVFQSIVRN